MSDLAAYALDHVADVVRRTPADDLPVFGRCWTLEITDEEIVVRIAQASKKVNGTPLPKQPLKPGQPAPEPQVHPSPKPQSPPKEDQ